MFLNKITVSVVLFSLFISISVQAQVKSLSDSACISLLIDTPSDMEVFTMFGHAALRVWDPVLDVDHVFNYGVFTHPSALVNLSQVMKGKMTCELFAIDFNDFKQASMEKGSALKEYTLAITPEEKEVLWQALFVNALPENRGYEYDMFRKNCVTLPITIIRENMSRPLILPDKIQHEERYSYRELCTPFLAGYPWIQFFADLYFGTIVEKK